MFYILALFTLFRVPVASHLKLVLVKLISLMSRVHLNMITITLGCVINGSRSIETQALALLNLNQKNKRPLKSAE